MNLYDEFEYGSQAMTQAAESDEGLAIAVILILLLVYAVIGIGLLVNYILSSLALTSLASRRGVENAWLAWLPIGCDWVLGTLVDRLEGLRGVSRKWGRLLLILDLIFAIGLVGGYVSVFAVMFSFAMSFEFMEAGAVLSILLPIYGIMIPVALAGSAATMLRWLCTYKVYEELVPQKVVKYTLISILVPFGRAACLMKCKDSPVGACPPPSYFYYAPPAPQQPAAGADPAFGYEVPRQEQNENDDKERNHDQNHQQ